MKKWIIKYYDFVFGGKETEEEVPYGNKQFMFGFSIAMFLVVVVFIVIDIIGNLASL